MPIWTRYVAVGMPIWTRYAAVGMPVWTCYVAVGRKRDECTQLRLRHVACLLPLGGQVMARYCGRGKRALPGTALEPLDLEAI
eukprot:261976-Chlamydomonas_euryale.AAC.1